MGKSNVHIKEIDTLNELKCQVNDEKLILCGEIQNTFLVISFDKVQKIGIAYYDYGILPDFYYYEDRRLFYLGVGMNLMCIDTLEEKVLVNDVLGSVFYELLYDFKTNYIYVICELDIYCYYLGKQKWRVSLGDIIEEYYIFDDTKIFVSCNDNSQYTILLKDGKIVEE